MADGSNDGTTNSTTAVTVIAAPAASTTRMIPARSVSLYNADTVAMAGKFRLNNNGTFRVIKAFEIPVGETWVNDNYISLDATTKSIEIILDAAITTTQGDWVSKHRDEAQ
jgi:hypothetical protein